MGGGGWGDYFPHLFDFVPHEVIQSKCTTTRTEKKALHSPGTPAIFTAWSV